MKEEKKYNPYKFEKLIKFIFICFSLSFFLFPASCGYHIVGSKPLPFRSVTIHPVKNTTYEPRLEEKLHNALSQEFITQGIHVMASGGEVDLTSTITTFQLRTIASIDEIVQEQAITFHVDVMITGSGRTIEFKTMHSPIRITFQTTGTVSEAVAQKERAVEKACSEIAREIISKMIIRYAS